jgi:hypothetical protein
MRDTNHALRATRNTLQRGTPVASSSSSWARPGAACGCDGVAGSPTPPAPQQDAGAAGFAGLTMRESIMGARFSPGTPIAGRASTEDQSMFRFLGWAALIVFIIGLLVVFGVIDFIF